MEDTNDAIMNAKDLCGCQALQDGMMRELSEDFPNMMDILKQEPKGAILSMRKNGALVKGEVQSSSNVSHTGDDNNKAWADYLKEINAQLKREVRDARAHLGGACAALGSHIHNKHWWAFGHWKGSEWIGTWPAVGGHQQSVISIRMDKMYDHGGDFVAVVVTGGMTIKDERPAQKEYIASLQGTPTFQWLKTDQCKLQAMEDACVRFGKAAILAKCRQRALDSQSITLSLADF